MLLDDEDSCSSSLEKTVDAIVDIFCGSVGCGGLFGGNMLTDYF
jgi:hypothetical protein